MPRSLSFTRVEAGPPTARPARVCRQPSHPPLRSGPRPRSAPRGHRRGTGRASEPAGEGTEEDEREHRDGDAEKERCERSRVCSWLREARDDRVQKRTNQNREGSGGSAATSGEETCAKGGESDVEERERTAGADPLIEAQVRKDLSDPGAEHGDRETHGLGHGRERVVRLVQRTRRSVGVDDRDVLDADAEAAREVHARRHREGHARLEALPISVDEVRVLVTIETDPVPGPTDEELAVTAVSDPAPPRPR